MRKTNRTKDSEKSQKNNLNYKNGMFHMECMYNEILFRTIKLNIHYLKAKMYNIKELSITKYSHVDNYCTIIYKKLKL